MSKIRIPRSVIVYVMVLLLALLVPSLASYLFSDPFEQVAGIHRVEVLFTEFGYITFWVVVSSESESVYVQFPGLLVAAGLISVFAMNRIRSLFLIGVAAVLSLLCLSWPIFTTSAQILAEPGSALMLVLISQLGLVGLETRETLHTWLFIAIWYLVLFLGTFLIIKIVAAAESRLIARRAVTDSVS